jgi:hypothetical protein
MMYLILVVIAQHIIQPRHHRQLDGLRVAGDDDKQAVRRLDHPQLPIFGVTSGLWTTVETTSFMMSKISWST